VFQHLIEQRIRPSGSTRVFTHNLDRLLTLDILPDLPGEEEQCQIMSAPNTRSHPIRSEDPYFINYYHIWT